MKWQRRYLGFALLGILIVTLAANRTVASNELGDIRYSILDPTHFAQVHGAGWVLMQGQQIQNTALCQDQGICTLPDGRGVFIRGMNLGRSTDRGDGAGDRRVGSSQSDQINAHQHEFLEWQWTVNSGSGPYGDGLTANRGRNPRVPTTGGPTGNETRPRNIAMYTYIKVE